MQPICPLVFCEVAVGSIFTLSFLSKISNFSQYINTIRKFRLIPEDLIQVVAVLILALELLTVLFLLTWQLAAFWLASALLILFSVALLTVLHRKIQTPCNCFGTSSHPVSHLDLVRNMGFLTCSIAGICLTTKPDVSLSVTSLDFSVTSAIALTFVFAGTQLSEIYRFFQPNYSSTI